MTPPRTMLEVRLRDARLTVKPRVTRAKFARGYWVERMTESNHPGMYNKARCLLVDTFPEAIAIALEWAGPRPQETP